MAHFLVKTGKHYHVMPPLSTLPWIGSRSMARTVTFDASCQYESAAYNSEDVNKLFGLSFGFGHAGFVKEGNMDQEHYAWTPGVHWNSARFGWRWSKADQCIELLAYCYVNGVRNQDAQLRFPVVAQVQLGEPVILSIHYWTEANGPYGRPHVEFTASPNENTASESVMVPASSGLPSYGLTHGLYWGGATPAPHDIHVTITR